MEQNTKKKRRKSHLVSFLTGEDIDMLQEREYDKRHQNDQNICDTHEDGA